VRRCGPKSLIMPGGLTRRRALPVAATRCAILFQLHGLCERPLRVLCHEYPELNQLGDRPRCRGSAIARYKCGTAVGTRRIAKDQPRRPFFLCFTNRGRPQDERVCRRRKGTRPPTEAADGKKGPGLRQGRGLYFTHDNKLERLGGWGAPELCEFERNLLGASEQNSSLRIDGEFSG
jgi:hypothetical protein